MVKDYDTEEIVMDKDQNLENENIIKQITVGEWADMLHHTHEGMTSSSSVASVLTLISTALADLGADTTEIDSAIAALSGEETTEEESTETEGDTEDGESEGETEGDDTEDSDSEGDDTEDGESEGETTGD